MADTLSIRLPGAQDLKNPGGKGLAEENMLKIFFCVSSRG
jgi:hypothetical protein